MRAWYRLLGTLYLVKRSTLTIAAAMLVAVAGGSYAAQRLLESGAAGPSSTIRCPKNARGWQGHISGPRIPSSKPGEERQVVRLVNSFRRAHGLSSLRTDRSLGLAARAHDADMQRYGYFDHERPELSFSARLARYTPSTCIAENIAWGTGSYGTPSGTVTAWKHSAGHRHVMLLPWVTRIGVGVLAGQNFQDVPGAVLTTADFSA